MPTCSNKCDEHEDKNQIDLTEDGMTDLVKEMADLAESTVDDIMEDVMPYV